MNKKKTLKNYFEDKKVGGKEQINAKDLMYCV